MNKKALAFGLVILGLIGGFVVNKNLKPKPKTLGDFTEIKKIKIGALIPLTGKFSFYGEDIKNGLSLAAEEIKRSGDVDFEIVYEDSGADPKMAVPAAKKLVEVDKVNIVLGGPGSSGNLAVAPLMEQSQTIFLAISSSPKMNEAGEYIFKINPDIDGEVKRMAEHIFSRGLKNVAVLYDSASDTNTTGAKIFADHFVFLGGQVVVSEGYDSKTTTDFKSSLIKIKSQNAQAVYFLGADLAAGPAIKQAREIGLNQEFFGWSALHTGSFLTASGDHANGVVITDFPFSCEGTIVMKNYCKGYKEEFQNFEPTQYGAHMYDTLHILARLARQYGVEDTNNLKTHLLEIQHYQGASGDITFDFQGNVRDKDFVFREIKNGKFVNLK